MAKRITNADLHDQIHSFRHDVKIELDHIRRMILALTQNEQQAVNDLSAAVETLATDLSGVTTAMQELNDKIAALTAQSGIDAATIADLQQSATDVVDALAPITARVAGIDQGLTSPPSPASPLSATN